MDYCTESCKFFTNPHRIVEKPWGGIYGNIYIDMGFCTYLKEEVTLGPSCYCPVDWYLEDYIQQQIDREDERNG